MYELFGSGAYSIDAENLIVSGTLHDGATDTGIGLEVRTGGPAIVLTSELHAQTVVSLLDMPIRKLRSRSLKVPHFYPLWLRLRRTHKWLCGIQQPTLMNSLKDLGDAGITISVFGGGVFAEVFIAQGIWSADQVDYPMVHLRTSSLMVEQSLSKVCIR